MFADNLVVVRPYDGQNCFNVGEFKQGHQHVFTDNQCLVLGCNGDCAETVGTLGGAGGCGDPANLVLRNNSYFTKAGNASIKCSYRDKVPTPLPDVQSRFHIEQASTAAALPPVDDIIRMVRTKVASWNPS